MKITYLRSLVVLILAAATFASATNSAQASTFTSDYLTAINAADTDGSFGPWTVGGYDNPTAAFGSFSAYGSAQYLGNWGSMLPANGNDGPFFAGQFKGFGYDNNLAVPAIVINTTNTPLSPCCGISQYAPGQVFLHSWDASVDPARQTQVIRYTAATTGLYDVNATFTQMHTGVIPHSVFLNGAALDTNTTGGQNTSQSYVNGNLLMTAGSVLEFAIAGQASSAFNATITAVPEPSSVALLGIGLVSCATLLRRRKQS